METAMIFNTIEEIWYYVVDGNWSRFGGIYINVVAESDQEEVLQDELLDLMYRDGKLREDHVSLDKFAAAIRDGAMVVECGIVP